MREQIDVYNYRKEKTGKVIRRGDDMEFGEFRLVAHCLIFNSEGLLLCQKRSITKAGYPLLWDISCGGCVTSGETSNQGIQREVYEELGLDFNFTTLQPCYTITSPYTFDDYYAIVANFDISDCKLQESEVVKVQWYSLEQIKQLLQTGYFCDYVDINKIQKLHSQLFQNECEVE